MREIKFRAWYMPFGHKGPLQEMVQGQASKTLAFAEMSPDNYIIEQYTGLKDVNGEEIYENDIVKVLRGSVDIIVFREGCFGIDANYSHPFTPLCSLDGSMEAVGNIHENPELLEV